MAAQNPCVSPPAADQSSCILRSPQAGMIADSGRRHVCLAVFPRTPSTGLAVESPCLSLPHSAWNFFWMPREYQNARRGILRGDTMNKFPTSRRQFLKFAGLTGAGLLTPGKSFLADTIVSGTDPQAPDSPADYTLRIASSPIELAPNHIVSAITYNGQFPGPLLRFKEGQQVVVDIFNDTDAPEQLHWHGQFLSPDVDGSAEEGTPYIPAHGKRRIQFMPRPAGFRFYHTHSRAGADLHAGQYSGQVGPVYVEPRHEPGNYDREVFLVLKEFEPSFSQSGDMAMDFLAPNIKVKELEASGESAMKASLAKGMPHGYEVGYRYFTINGRMSGHGEP